MAQNRHCDNCNVNISSDLSNCPLCGKYVIKNDDKVVQNTNSYPIYSLKTVTFARWYNIIRCLFWVIGVACTVTNLMFKTEPYWFPYVLAALVLIFNAFIATIKHSVSSYIKNLTFICILVGLFVIFIDVYNHLVLSTNFGWGYGIVAPMVMMSGVVVSGIICLSSRMYESYLLRRITFVAIISIIYFIITFFFFKNIPAWPSLVFMNVSISFVVVLELFKRNKLVKELAKEFHL